MKGVATTAAILAVLAQPCSAFQPLLSASNLPSNTRVHARCSSSLGLRASSSDDAALARRDVLCRLAVAGFVPLLQPQASEAKAGEYARMELDGRGGNSISGLGKNDIPGAGKIDPYDNREKANAEYAERMASSDMISESRVKAVAIKKKTFETVATSIEKEDWKSAKLVLDRDLIDLRRAMNAVSTRGLKAISAAQKGGEPDKIVDEAEKIERTYLNLLNKLSASLNGNQRKVDFTTSKTILDKMETTWALWEAATVTAK